MIHKKSSFYAVSHARWKIWPAQVWQKEKSELCSDTVTACLPIRLREELTRQKDKQGGFNVKALVGVSLEEPVSPTFWVGTIKTRSHWRKKTPKQRSFTGKNSCFFQCSSVKGFWVPAGSIRYNWMTKEWLSGGRGLDDRLRVLYHSLCPTPQQDAGL